MPENPQPLFDQVEAQILAHHQGKPGTEVSYSSGGAGDIPVATLHINTSALPGLRVETKKVSGDGDLRDSTRRLLKICIKDPDLQKNVAGRLNRRLDLGLSKAEILAVEEGIGDVIFGLEGTKYGKRGMIDHPDEIQTPNWRDRAENGRIFPDKLAIFRGLIADLLSDLLEKKK